MSSALDGNEKARLVCWRVVSDAADDLLKSAVKPLPNTEIAAAHAMDE